MNKGGTSNSYQVCLLSSQGAVWTRDKPLAPTHALVQLPCVPAEPAHEACNQTPQNRHARQIPISVDVKVSHGQMRIANAVTSRSGAFSTANTSRAESYQPHRPRWFVQARLCLWSNHRGMGWGALLLSSFWTHTCTRVTENWSLRRPRARPDDAAVSPVFTSVPNSEDSVPPPDSALH